VPKIKDKMCQRYQIQGLPQNFTCAKDKNAGIKAAKDSPI